MSLKKLEHNKTTVLLKFEQQLSKYKPNLPSKFLPDNLNGTITIMTNQGFYPKLFHLLDLDVFFNNVKDDDFEKYFKKYNINRDDDIECLECFFDIIYLEATCMIQKKLKEWGFYEIGPYDMDYIDLTCYKWFDDNLKYQCVELCDGSKYYFYFQTENEAILTKLRFET